jgi:hypothetical protein
MPHRTRFLALLAGLVVAFAPMRAAIAQSPERLVLAFYYNWFDENSWGPSKMSDQPQTPYASRDRGAMGRQIDQAKAAGIDALVVNWWGPQADNQTEINLRAMLDEAAARGFRIAVDVDMNSPYLGSAGAIQAAMSHLLANEAQHRAYLRVGGKPVIFFYHQDARLGTGGWAAMRAAIDKDHNSLWIEEGVDVSPLSVFDGHHLYSVTWANGTDLAYTANKFGRLVRAKASEVGSPKVYVATVMPGYNDLRTGRGSAFAVDRAGGAYYEGSWQAAIGAAPDWVVINSFNEWPEGTYVEPSQAFGNQYLDLTRKWAGAFRSALPTAAGAIAPTPLPVKPPVAPVPKLAPVPVPTPVPTPNPLWERQREHFQELRWGRAQ